MIRTSKNDKQNFNSLIHIIAIIGLITTVPDPETKMHASLLKEQSWKGSIHLSMIYLFICTAEFRTSFNLRAQILSLDIVSTLFRTNLIETQPLCKRFWQTNNKKFMFYNTNLSFP